MADTQSILQLGIEAARSGDKAEARELFRLVTREDANNVQGWLWLAGVAEDRDEKRVALERVLQLDPSSELARKGLAALGGASAARVAATPPTVTPSAPTPSPEPTFQPTAAPTGPASDQDIADSFDSIDDYAAAPASGRSRVYEQPDQVGGYVPPDFGDDDYDLADYQDRPRAVDTTPDRDRVVVIEDEEPRRRGLGAWLPALLILLLVLGGLSYALWRSFGGSDTNVATDPTGSASGELGAVVGDPGASGSAATDASAPATSSDATGLLASPAAVVDPAASAAPGTEGSAAAGGTTSPAAVPPVDASAAAPPPVDASAAAPPPVDASAAAPPPVDASAAAPPVDASAAAPPPAAPPVAPPAAPADVATANPAIIPNTQVLRAGDFEYTFTTFANVATGSYGGAPPARGRYLIVLMAVRNASGAPAQVPDGFFVIKDAQGRVSDFNRAASVDYINRFGGTGPRGAGDYAADAQLPPGAPLGSMPFLFDVAADATDLVVFSRDNTAQGFLVRQSAR